MKRHILRTKRLAAVIRHVHSTHDLSRVIDCSLESQRLLVDVYSRYGDSSAYQGVEAYACKPSAHFRATAANRRYSYT